MAWTDERVEQLKKLWSEGLSASQIARTMGGVTRNAVIGKVHRLGLAGRSTSSRSERPRRVTVPKPVAKPVPMRPIIVEEPLKLDNGEFVTVLNVSDRMCKWPIGDPATNEFRFCGRPNSEGSPYCSAHNRLAYQPVQQRRNRKRAMAG